MKAMKSLRRAFTLIEIMIVVLIIGMLLAIAVPNFVRARETATARVCVKNLKTIEASKELWAMDNRKESNAEPNMTDLMVYLKSTPECPWAGVYVPHTMADNPTCSKEADGYPTHSILNTGG
jgi:prepilin-type N-terminal cleavage/methylation domain-containing protein